MSNLFYIPISDRPSWFSYPDLYKALVDRGKHDFDLWYFMTSDKISQRRKGLLQRYPDRELIPFAKRDDNDDIACWDAKNPTSVYIIHDFSSSGYEQKYEFLSFEEWYKSALQEAEDF